MLLIILFLLFVSPSAFSASASEQLVNIFERMHTVQADFHQIVLDNKANILQESHGKMEIQRPGLFRWEITSPSKQLLIADGKKIWFYDVELQQVSIQRQSLAYINGPAALLSGSSATVIKNFKVSQIAGKQIFVLQPVYKQNLFLSVILNFSHDELRSMQLIDNFGQSTKITFSKVRINAVLNPKDFYFVLPKQADIVSD